MAFLHLLEGIRNPVLDILFQGVTLFGEETLFILFGLLFFWCIDKREGYFLLCGKLCPFCTAHQLWQQYGHAIYPGNSRH